MESFENALIQIAVAPKSLAAVAFVVVRDTAATAPIVRYSAKIVKQEVEESVKDLVLVAPSPPLSGLDQSSNKVRKVCKNKMYMKIRSRRKSSVFSSDKGMWL